MGKKGNIIYNKAATRSVFLIVISCKFLMCIVHACKH